jgi:hypothetical protein
METVFVRSTNMSSTNAQGGGSGSNQTINDIAQNLEMEKILEGRSVRVAFGVVSALLAIYVIYRIWLDNYRTTVLSFRRRSKYDSFRPDICDVLTDRNRRLSFMYQLHTAEVFPLVLGFAIFTKEISLVVIQAITINQFPSFKCKEPGVFALPSS